MSKRFKVYTINYIHYHLPPCIFSSLEEGFWSAEWTVRQVLILVRALVGKTQLHSRLMWHDFVPIVYESTSSCIVRSESCIFVETNIGRIWMKFTDSPTEVTVILSKIGWLVRSWSTLLLPDRKISQSYHWQCVELALWSHKILSPVAGHFKFSRHDNQHPFCFFLNSLACYK